MPIIHKIVKKIFIVIILSLLSTIGFGQAFNNEWIDYDQEYFKILVHQDGIYRIPYSQLIASGIPVDQIDPRWIQLFYEGEEQYIYIEGGNSGIFNPNGYIEFYGKRNRGMIDTAVFASPEDVINPDYSMFNDTSVYFFTWNGAYNNKRINVLDDTDFSEWLSNSPDYCFKTVRQNYTGNYITGSTRCIYGDGEGWFDTEIIKKDHPVYGTVNVTKSIETPNVYDMGPDTEIECAVVGFAASSPDNFYPHHLKVNFLGDVRIDELYSGYEHIIANLTINSNILTSTISMTFSSNDITNTSVPDQNVISYINIKYPHTLNFENQETFTFNIPTGSGSYQLLEITGFNSSDNNDITLYDISGHNSLKVVFENETFKALLPENGEERTCVLYSSDAIKTIDDIIKVSSNNKFVDYLSEYPDVNYLIITHSSLWSSAEQYATYRSSTGYNIALADVNQLYDQFAYGVKLHPLAIRRYIQFMHSEGASRPHYLFLFGKGIHARDYRKSTINSKNCLLPSIGNPSSDNLFTVGMLHNDFKPELATGRIAVKNNEEGLIYLNKVIEYESNTSEEWMKNIMHFGGGANASEQTIFANYLHNYELIIEDTLFGGYVSTFLKNSSEPIQITQSDSVRNLINNGVTMMTFFGHASASGFDQSIDDPINYNNAGKYPFVLANSCFAGDIHLYSSTSTSEDWVIIPDKGAIAFFASVGEGIPSYLNQFSNTFYNKIGNELYGFPIGAQIIATINDVQDGNLNNVRTEMTCHEFTLHGDPGIILNSHPKPDLTIKPSGISFTPNEINTYIDSFEVEVVVTNIARATSTPFVLQMTRTYPNDNIDEYSMLINGCNYKDTVYFKLPVDKSNGSGLNKLKFNVDAFDVIEEMSETNNQLEIAFLIKSADLFPIHPYEFSIYPSNNVRLIASTGNPFTSTADYIFQIDTTDQFNSIGGEPLLEQTQNENGGIISWDVPILLQEETVYYWRIARHHAIADSMVWKESSFIYIPNEEGWSQAHHFQFKKDKYSFIDFNRPDRSFDFVEIPKSLLIYTHRYVNSSTYSDVRYTIDGAVNNGLGDYGCCGNQSAMIIAVIDPETILAWGSAHGDYGHRNFPQCYSSGRENYYFVFSTGYTQSGSDYIYQESMDNMISMIESVPDGYYIIAYSWYNAYFELWQDEWLDVFENLGGVNIRSLSNDQAYILFSRKGQPTGSEETYSTGHETIHLDIDLETDFIYGSILSTTIGPATSWESLHWNQKDIDPMPHDSSSLSVWGIQTNGTKDLLIDNIHPGNYDIFGLSDSIDVNEYPFLELNFFTQDDSTKTPGQLKRWQVKHEGVPETAISPDNGYKFCCDTLQEGDSVYFAIATKNISPYNMDSLSVKYWIQNFDNEIIPLGYKTLDLHPANNVLIDTISFSTLGMHGLNSIWVEYNPINPATGVYYQLEQYHFNNIAQKLFYVNNDSENPLLDVSFDGIHIMNGDIVSANPEILIQLKDENQYLALNDTSFFRIYLSNIEEGTERRVYFSSSRTDETLEWLPAVLPDNSCKIYYKPYFVNDGQYQLRVQATDASNNESGDFDYNISFEVITKSTITNVLNYPNPFSTSTRFVFELTGYEVPDNMRIDIFTVSGKLVRSIFMDELGPIHIGRNITEFAWDGTDVYGDKLANGVYFYRVKIISQGTDFEKRNTDADKYFKNNFGKMYLMR